MTNMTPLDAGPLWQNTYRKGLRADFSPTPSTLIDEFRAAVAAYGETIYLEFAGRSWSYARFGTLVENAAAGLRALGIGEGWHVALHMPNVPQYAIALFAVLRVGGVVVNLSPLDAEREIAHKLAIGEARAVISFSGLHEKIPRRPDLLLVIAGMDDLGHAPDGAPPPPDEDAGVHHFGRLLAAAPAVEEPTVEAWPTASPGDLAVLQFTGGTTGVPKAAMLTHANLTAAMAIYCAWFEAEEDEPAQHRVLTVLPLFHIYALSCILLPAMRSGQTLILKARWDTDDILDTIASSRPTAFYGVPTMFTALLASQRASDTDLSSLRICSSGGASLAPELLRAFRSRTGLNLNDGWGMTETCSAGTATPRRKPKLGSAGVPLPGIDVRIRDLENLRREVPRGEKGEICVRGPNIISGYYRNDDANADGFVDGYFRTGDIGYFDEDGYLFIVDRRKDMIISSGYNVFPRIIEEAVLEHPAVLEAIVIGVPDTYRGEMAKAFVVLRQGMPAFRLEELRAFLSDRLGRHELPGALEFRDQLLKTVIGKLARKPLVDEERAKAAASANPKP